MAWLERRVTRTSQPQELVGLDSSNEFVPMLVCALDAATGRDVVTGRPLTYVGSFAQDSGVLCVAHKGDGASLGYVDIPQTLPMGISMLGVMNGNTSTAAGSIEFGLGSSAGNALAAYQCTSSPRNRFILRQTNSGSLSERGFSVGAFATSPHIASFSSSGSLATEIEVYRDGLNDSGVSLDGSSGTNAIFDRFAIGGIARSTFSYAQSGDQCALALLLNQVLTEEQHKRLADNPWQIFEPEIGYVWVEIKQFPTFVQPVGTVSTGSWTPTGAATLYGAINEVTPSDAEYISVTGANTCEMILEQAQYPGTANQVLSYYASSTNGSMITITLKQGTTTIMSRTHALTATNTLYNQTLTAPEIASIVAGPINVTLATS